MDAKALKVSERVRAFLASPATPVTPWSRSELLACAEQAGGLSRCHVDTEAAIFELTGRRGMPVVGEYIFGLVESRRAGHAAVDASTRARWSLIGHHPTRGPLYLGPRGKLMSPMCSAADSISVLLERLAAEFVPRRPLYGLRVYKGRAGEVASALRVPRNKGASDSLTKCWADDRWFITEHVLFARRQQDVRRLLEVCNERGLGVIVLPLSTTTRIEIERCDGSAPEDTVPPRAAYTFQGAATLTIWHDDEHDTYHQAIRYGEHLVEHDALATSHRLSRRWHRAEGFLTDRVSPRALDFCASHRMLWLPSLRRGARELARLLSGRDIPAWQSLLDLEERFAGLLMENPLDYPEREWAPDQPVIFLAPAALLESAKTKDKCAGSSSASMDGPRRGDLRIRWQGLDLHWVGLLEHWRALFMDEEGRIYEYSWHDAELVPMADNACALLERLAAEWKMNRDTDAIGGLLLPPELGTSIARKMRLHRVDEASTFIYTYYCGDGLWIRVREGWGERPGSTRIRAERAADMIKLAGALVTEHPGLVLRADSADLVEALAREGITAAQRG